MMWWSCEALGLLGAVNEMSLLDVVLSESVFTGDACGVSLLLIFVAGQKLHMMVVWEVCGVFKRCKIWLGMMQALLCA